MSRSQETGKTILRVLTEAEREGAHAYALLQRAQETIGDTDARAFAGALVRGVIERYLTLDYAINLFASKKTDVMKPVIRNILRMGAYEILFMDRVADGAAVDGCVRLARASGFSMLSGFVNGVLRALAREKNGIEYPTKSIRYSVPEWICELLEHTYGEAETERMLAYFNTRSPLTLRFDERLDDAEIKSFTDAVAANRGRTAIGRHPLFSYAYQVWHADNPRMLPGYDKGAFAVQDAGAMVVTEVCGVSAGDLVIDVCAAPGGKALHLANRLEHLGGGGFVYAFDKDERKCARIRENTSRMRVANIRTDVWDARKTRPDLAGMADVVLCDVPCSGLGVIGRKADIRYRVHEEDIDALCALQREIVTAAADYLREGGTLVYATCTLTRSENTGNARFIERELGLKPSPLTPYLPAALASGDTAGSGYLTLLPGRHETDGFFVARFTK